MKQNAAGRLAALFLESKLTPLIMAASLAIGVWTLANLASEEEPQIIVPLADLYLPLPGATPDEVENRLLIPLEQVLSGIQGVEYVYSHAASDFGLVTVRFEVGRDMEQSLIQLHSTLYKYMDRMPPGFGLPLIKAITIDDVPFYSAILLDESGDADQAALRRLAEELQVELAGLPDVRDVHVLGGYPREIRVELDSERLARFGLDPLAVVQRLGAENVAGEAGYFADGDQVVRVVAGSFLATADDVAGVILGVQGDALIRVRDVARVVDGPAEVAQYTFHLEGDAGVAGSTGWVPMVGLSVSKRAGADATNLGRAIEAKFDDLRGRLIPGDVTLRTTRNYGETARDKVVTLQGHLLLAVLSVGLIILLTMGWRAALVVVLSVPLTFALTLFVYQIFGYTLNRVTLFALIFVTGIVVDDSIIVAENMERHFRMRDRPKRAAALAAVAEVGNPTILATLTVIAAVLPMLFVSGLMGPYMSPMPIGATVAMLFSLLLALTVTPWLALKLLGSDKAHGKDEAPYVLENTLIYRFYQRTMGPLLERPVALMGTLAGITVVLIASLGMFTARWVQVKMLPFDDKNEVQVIMDLPAGTPLEVTLALASDLGLALAQVPEVSDVQLYAGLPAPINFNGMMRQYYLRSGPNVADLQINLVDKGDRKLQSHDVALKLRAIVDEVVAASGTEALARVVEVPPGPPVLSTLVAEIYADDEAERVRVAEAVLARFKAQPGVVDVDWSRNAPHREVRLDIDTEKAAHSGIAKEHVVGVLQIALGGTVATHLSDAANRSVVPVRVQLSEGDRSGIDRLGALRLTSATGGLVPAGSLIEAVETERPQVIFRKNGRRVIYVMAEVAGELESPAYAMLDLRAALDEIEVAGGVPLPRLLTGAPEVTERAVLRWDGEWQVTYEVFRDLGIAFAGALLLIYVLIVAWFGSFTTPLVMMAAIPLTLIGIAPGHMAAGAFFTATSMIGMIALAGIMVRNGILLIDYLEARTGAGVPLKRAIIEAGAVRTRPILVTAITVIIGAFVILFDPIFQGLAVSLVAGAFASTVLTLVAVPGLYFLLKRGWKEEVSS